MRGRRSVASRAVVALTVVAAAIAAVVLLGRGGDYEVRAVFLDAGQLVRGNTVEVAGRRIGSVHRLRLTDDGRAEVVLRITDEDHQPLHRGTRMAIRTVGLSGVANRYIDLTPGARSAPEIEDGGVVGTDATQGIVDLDMLLNAFGPATRRDLRTLLVQSAKGLDGTTGSVNRLLRLLNPAVGPTRALLEDLTADQAAVESLVTAGSTVAGGLASRDDDIDAGLGSAARTLEAVASQRGALRRGLRRAPGVLRNARGTLRDLRGTITEVRPALRETRPIAVPLRTFLRRLVPTARAARPVLRDAQTLLPPLRRTLAAAPGLARIGLPALRSTTSAVDRGLPVFAGLRAYALDALQGVALGAGNIAGHYDANGHYIRIVGNLDLTRSSPAGLLGLLPDVELPSLDRRYSGATARCPGSSALPLRDGSNRLQDGDRALCDPEDGRP